MSNFATTGIYTWDNTISNTADVTTWIADFEFSSWEPYLFEKYVPKWHITEGYKIQISTMWK